MKNLSILLLSSFLLIGCAGTKKIDIIAASAPIVIQHPPLPRGVIMRKVEWRVLNAEILQQMLKNGDDVQFIALTPTGYENLSLNMGEIKRYIKQQRQVVVYYQNITNGAGIETPEGKKWKFKDLLPNKEVTPDVSLDMSVPLLGLDYLPSTE